MPGWLLQDILFITQHLCWCQEHPASIAHSHERTQGTYLLRNPNCPLPGLAHFASMFLAFTHRLNRIRVRFLPLLGLWSVYRFVLAFLNPAPDLSKSASPRFFAYLCVLGRDICQGLIPSCGDHSPVLPQQKIIVSQISFRFLVVKSHPVLVCCSLLSVFLKLSIFVC